MTSTEPNAEVDITRANALDVDLVLGDEEQVLSSQLKATVDPAERAELFWRAARNQERQAVTWDLRPGRTRDNQPRARKLRSLAHRCAAAAEIEQLRAGAATRARHLPDPMPILQLINPSVHGSDHAAQTLLALYTMAAATA